MILEVTDINKVYSEDLMLDNISFSLNKGDFLALIGKENSGKTPLLELIMGLKFPESGTIKKEIQDRDIKFIPDDIIYVQNLTAIQLFNRTLHDQKIESANECETLCELFGIELEEKLIDMTYNDNKLVAIINALITHPAILILDEPYDFLNQKCYFKLLTLLKRRCVKGMTVVLSCEKFTDVRGFCNRYIYLQEGDLVKSGDVDENFSLWKMITIFDGDCSKLKEIGAHPINTVGRKNTYVYKNRGPAAMKDLAAAIGESGCSNYFVEEMTLEEQLFYDMSRWN